MNKKDISRLVTELLKNSSIRKPVYRPKHRFYVSDDSGNSTTFTVQTAEKDVAYTLDDVTTIIDACFDVIQECIGKGERVSISGFGSFGLKFRKPRTVKSLDGDGTCYIEGHYVPKFTSGNNLKLAVKLYEVSMAENALSTPLPIFDENEGTEGGE